MDYDVIYLDDERNAVNDHRRPGNRTPVRRPGGSSVVVPGTRRPTVIHAGGGAASTGYYPAAASSYSAPYPAPYYQDPRVLFVPQSSGFRLGNLTGGELAELLAKAYVAFQPIPTAPASQGDMEIDLSNLVEFQRRLAECAKRSFQITTLGDLVAKLWV